MNNKLDPVHAVAGMALALVEIQKDIAQLRREATDLMHVVSGMDKALVNKFTEVDKRLQFLFGQPKEVPNAADNQGKQGDELDAEDLWHKEESRERLLCDGQRGEVERSGGEEEQISLPFEE